MFNLHKGSVTPIGTVITPSTTVGVKTLDQSNICLDPVPQLKIGMVKLSFGLQLVTRFARTILPTTTISPPPPYFSRIAHLITM